MFAPTDAAFAADRAVGKPAPLALGIVRDCIPLQLIPIDPCARGGILLEERAPFDDFVCCTEGSSAAPDAPTIGAGTVTEAPPSHALVSTRFACPSLARMLTQPRVVLSLSLARRPRRVPSESCPRSIIFTRVPPRTSPASSLSSSQLPRIFSLVRTTNISTVCGAAGAAATASAEQAPMPLPAATDGDASPGGAAAGASGGQPAGEAAAEQAAAPMESGESSAQGGADAAAAPAAAP